MASKIFITALASMIAMVIVAAVQAGSIVGEVKFTDAPPQLKPVKVRSQPLARLLFYSVSYGRTP